MWKKDYSAIYGAISSCPAWPNHLKNIMNLISESTRQRATELISRAYSTILLSEASSLLGQTEEDTLRMASNLGWIYESTSGYLEVKKPDTKTTASKSKNLVMGVDQSTELLEKLTDYIVFLESSAR